ncbi:hypothetical protein D3C72_975420 [compost metagenome]
MGHGVAIEHGQPQPQTQRGPQPIQRQGQPGQQPGILSVFQQPGGDDRARHDGEKGEGEQGDEDGQKIELEEAVGFGFVVDQIKSGQQGLETPVCGVAADHQGQGALRRDGARRGMSQTLDFIDEDGAGGVRQHIGQCGRLLTDLTD